MRGAGLNPRLHLEEIKRCCDEKSKTLHALVFIVYEHSEREFYQKLLEPYAKDTFVLPFELSDDNLGIGRKRTIVQCFVQFFKIGM